MIGSYLFVALEEGSVPLAESPAGFEGEASANGVGKR